MKPESQEALCEIVDRFEEEIEALENVLYEEEYCIDNTPEDQKQSEAYKRAELAVSNLEDAISSLKDAITSINEAINK